MRQHNSTGIASLLVTVMLVLAPPVSAQDAEEAPAAEENTAAPEEAPAGNADSQSESAADEEIIVDDGSYLDAEDDDFIPSEEISADRSITFPTDI